MLVKQNIIFHTLLPRLNLSSRERRKLMASHSPNLNNLLFLLLLLPVTYTTSVNVSSILSDNPDFSIFNRLLSTLVATELSSRSSLTILAVPNKFLSRSTDLLHSNSIADVVRFHVLLEYLSWPDLSSIPSPSGRLVATLFQTTGRAPDDLGALNLTRRSTTIVAYSPTSNATFLSLVRNFPYNVSVFSVNSLLTPYSYDLAASDASPPPVTVNISRILLDGKEFNVVASMLDASGVRSEFEHDEKGAGITMFVPTDEAFGDLAVTEQFQSLTADLKATILKYHVLHSYYPLGSLESIVNPVQPTIATETVGPGKYTLNITRVNGSVAISTGIVQALITRTVFDQSPVSVFAVSRVLLPREVFGKEMERVASSPPPPQVVGVSPVISPAANGDPALGLKGEVTSASGKLVAVLRIVYSVAVIFIF